MPRVDHAAGQRCDRRDPQFARRDHDGLGDSPGGEEQEERRQDDPQQLAGGHAQARIDPPGDELLAEDEQVDARGDHNRQTNLRPAQGEALQVLGLAGGHQLGGSRHDHGRHRQDQLDHLQGQAVGQAVDRHVLHLEEAADDQGVGAVGELAAQHDDEDGRAGLGDVLHHRLVRRFEPNAHVRVQGAWSRSCPPGTRPRTKPTGRLPATATWARE